MDETEQEELAFFDFLGAHEAALNAAVGALMVDNVPVERLRIIAETTTCSTIRLAAKVALWHRRG